MTRAVGLLRGPALRETFRKIAAKNPHLNLRREAVLALARYDDEDAVAILSDLLADINNTYFSKTINNEVARITEKSPHLAVMRSFRDGSKDAKSF